MITDQIDLCDRVGRADDVITLASGEKFVPTPMEGIIMGSPLLQGAVIFGRERNQVGILVESRPKHAVDVLDENAVASFRNEIWSVFSRFMWDDNYRNADRRITGQSTRKQTGLRLHSLGYSRR